MNNELNNMREVITNMLSVAFNIPHHRIVVCFSFLTNKCSVVCYSEQEAKKISKIVGVEFSDVFFVPARYDVRYYVHVPLEKIFQKVGKYNGL